MSAARTQTTTSATLGLSLDHTKTIIGTQGTLTLTDYDPVTGKSVIATNKVTAAKPQRW